MARGCRGKAEDGTGENSLIAHQRRRGGKEKAVGEFKRPVGKK